MESPKRHILPSLPSTIPDKPRITIPIPVVRTVPGHMLWCSAEGTPPINMALFQNSTFLAQGTGIVAANVTKEGNVTCVATNKAGSVSKTFPVTLKGIPFVWFCL